ncbi:MAG: radical SAM protein [Peptostreptococcaceae bacterium]
MSYKFIENTVQIVNEDKVILANQNNGYFIRISKEIFDILNIMIDNKLSIEELLSKLNDDEDRDYINKLFYKLINNVIQKQGDKDQNNKNELAAFEITHRCNLHCTHCCIDADCSISDNEDLSTNETIDIIDKLVEWNPKAIMISGGEPMIRSDFIELMKYLRKNYDGKIILSTNGTLINDENISILSKCFDKIDISLDGVDEESCSIVRGKGVFDKVIKNIKRIQNSGFYNISLSMVISDKNEHLEENFRDLNKTLGTQPLVRLFEPIGRGKDNKSIFSNKGEDEIYIPLDYLSEDYKKISIRTCSAGKKELFISHDGDIYPCVQFIEDQFKLGNIKNIDRLSELNNDYNNMSLRLINPNNFEQCKKCKVNLFCWTCPGQLKELKDSKLAFEYRCKAIKPVLFKRVWGVEV